MDLQYPYPPNQSDLAQAVAKLGSDLAGLQQTVQAMSTGGQSGGGPPACSKKQAYTYIAEIALPQGTTARTPGTFTVSQDGPFVALAVQAAWRETAGVFAGRWVPPSSTEMYIRNIGTFNFANPPRPDVVDFEWEVSDGNSDRNWQDKPVPSAFLYSTNGQPLYLPEPQIFLPNTTVTVSVTPVRPVTSAGLLKIAFWGYKALGLPQVGRVG